MYDITRQNCKNTLLCNYQRRQASTTLAQAGVRKLKSMYIKEFDAWNTVKKRVDEEKRQVYIRAGEVRWVSIGVNVGSEIDGKGVSFTRPALVLHVMGSHLALVVPLSTKVKVRAGYVPFEWKGEQTSLCIHQLKIVSQKRIFARLGKISKKRLSDTKTEVTTFFNL